MWVQYNPNPAGRNVGDCAVRAVAKALDLDWRKAFALIVTAAFNMCDMPSSNAVWGSVLMQHGFVRRALSDSCPDCYTAQDFCRDHQQGTYVLGFGNHTCCIVDGDIYDSFDSSSEVPQYYWKKEDEK